MRENGCHWCEIHKFGSIDVVAYHNGGWVKDWVINEGDVTVISTPIAFPTAAELAAHKERLARIGQEILDKDGADPRWDGVHVDGAYWIKRDGYEPEIALSLEGGWCSYLLGLPGYDWEIYPGKPASNVLFGPLDKPGGRHRQSTYLATLLECEQQQEQAAEGPRRSSHVGRRRPPSPWCRQGRSRIDRPAPVQDGNSWDTAAFTSELILCWTTHSSCDVSEANGCFRSITVIRWA